MYISKINIRDQTLFPNLLPWLWTRQIQKHAYNKAKSKKQRLSTHIEDKIIDTSDYEADALSGHKVAAAEC